MARTDANGANTETVEYERIIALFTGSNSAEMHERHISAIDRLCSGNTTGVAIRDLPKVQKILELTLQLIRSGLQNFMEPACALLRTLSKPYAKRSSTDEFKMPGHIVSILTAVGQVFSTNFPHQLQVVAAEMLITFATAQSSRPSVLDIETSKKVVDAGSAQRQYHMNQELIAQSSVISAAIRGLATAILGGDAALMYSLVQLLLNCSYLQSNCVALLDAGILACMPHLLSVDYKHELASPAVELLWNLVEFAPTEAKAALASPQPFITRLMRGGGMQAESARPSRGDGGDYASEGMDAAEGGRPSMEASAASAGGEAGSRSMKHVSMYDVQDSAANNSNSNNNNNNNYSNNGNDHNDAASDYTEAASAGGTSFKSAMRDVTSNGGSIVDAESSQAAIAEESSIGGGDADTQLQQQQAPMSEGTELITAALAEALVAMFRTVLSLGCRRSDKELRNDILVVINHLLSAPGFPEPCLSSGLFQAALAVAVSPEMMGGLPHVHHWALTTEECDMELRLLSWQTASQGSRMQADVRAIAADMGFLRVLTMHIDMAAEGAPTITRWSKDQLATMRSAALSRLFEVAPLSAQHFLNVGGFSVILAFLADSLRGGGATGSGVMNALVLGTLRLLHRICATTPSICDTFGSIPDSIKLLIDLVQQAPQDSPKPDGGLRHLSLLLLSVLCSSPAAEGNKCSNIHRFRQECGVQMLIEQLKVLHRSDATLPSPFAIALLDAVWRCVIPDKKSTARFLVDEGLDVMLKVLEVGNRAHRPIMVSLLADLLSNPKTHTFFHDWRSDLDKKTAAHMLLTIWQEEDALRGMSKQGLIINTMRPLTGKGKRDTWVPSESLAYGNLEAKRHEELQMLKGACSGDKLLEKLYAAFKVVGMDTLSYLSIQDQAQLCMVEKYVKFRQGEVWREIDAEFEVEGMRPTSPDRVRLDSGIELAEHIARAVVDSQSSILGRYTDSIKTQEQKYLDNMLAQRKLEQEMRFYQKDRSQLTLAELREAKRKKEEMLQYSIKDFNFKGEGLELEDPKVYTKKKP